MEKTANAAEIVSKYRILSLDPSVCYPLNGYTCWYYSARTGRTLFTMTTKGATIETGTTMCLSGTTMCLSGKSDEETLADILEMAGDKVAIYLNPVDVDDESAWLAKMKSITAPIPKPSKYALPGRR